MTPKMLVIAVGLLLVGGSIPACAQDTKQVTVQEKVMAARLLKYDTPPLPKPYTTIRCSNALAMVRVVVSADGKVVDAEYVSGYPELKETALAAARGWSYTPYRVHGKPAQVETQVSIFYLGDGESFPMYVPDGKGGVKGGIMMPLPPGCGPGPKITIKK